MATLSEAHFELAKTLLQSVADWYVKTIDEHAGTDMVNLSRLSVLALSQYSAMLAVDVAMTEEQFLAVNKANFQEAYAKAPKFGA